MKVFVTGALGFVGRNLIARLKQQGIEVCAVDIIPGQDRDHYVADIRSKNIVDIIPSDTDTIIHLAGLTRNPDCQNKGYACFDANVMATLNLIDAAEARKVKRFIFASTEWVYDSFKENEIKTEDSPIDISKLTSEYALSKHVSEANLRQKFAHGFCSVVILRFGIIYGPRESNWSAVESLFNAVKSKDEVAVGSLKSGRCFIHVADIVEGIVASLKLDGFHLLNLQGEKLITLGEVIETSKKILKREPRVIEKDPANISLRWVSNAKAKSVLNCSVSIDLMQGLKTL